MQASLFRLLKIPTIWKVVLALLALAPIVVVGFYLVESSRLRAAQKEITYGKPEDSKHFWKFEMPGIQTPQALPAAASKIADSDEVIGVVVNGKPRAYWLKALKYPPWHIVNDVVVGVPVSVTHCDRTNCTRVYTSTPSSTPLDLNLGGLYGNEMVVEAGGALYLQETGKPFEPARVFRRSLTRITPGNARPGKRGGRRHPETDVFIGLGGIGPKP